MPNAGYLGASRSSFPCLLCDRQSFSLIVLEVISRIRHNQGFQLTGVIIKITKEHLPMSYISFAELDAGCVAKVPVVHGAGTHSELPAAALKSIMRRIAVIVFCIAGFLFQSNMASAGIVIPTPANLNPGDHFRIIFVTSGTTPATSNDIAYYNDFVNAQAGGATYEGQLIQWYAIGSTPAVDAVTNTDSALSSPVYMVDGRKVASSTMDLARGGPGGLWSSSLIRQPTEGIDGKVYTSGFVWTGTAGNGVEYSTEIFGGYGLGSNNRGFDPSTQTYLFSTPQVQVGSISASQTGSNWVQIPNNSATDTPGLKSWTNAYQMYGMSQELTVTPEPSTLLSSAVGLFVVALVKRKCRRRTAAC